MNLKWILLFILLFLHIPIYIFASLAASSAIFNFVHIQVRSRISSVCHAPFMSLVCSIVSWQPAIPAIPDIPAALDSEFEGLDRLLRATAKSTPRIGRELAQARFAIDDLIVVAKSGGLRCRDQLVEELKGFKAEAREIAQALHRFVWRVNFSAKRVQSANEQTIALLEIADARSPTLRALCPIGGNFLRLPACQRSRELRLMFNTTLHSFESTVTSLMKMSGNLNEAFTGLEARLDTIHDIAATEGHIVLAERDEVLADIWTALGANRKAWARLRTQANALHLVIIHHETAHDYVFLAHQELVAMDVALEDLRSLAVESILNQDKYSIRVLIDTLSRGVERLKERDKKDSSHLEPPQRPVQDPRAIEFLSIG